MRFVHVRDVAFCRPSLPNNGDIGPTAWSTPNQHVRHLEVTGSVEGGDPSSCSSREYEMERTCDHMLTDDGELKYLVKWLGYPKDEMTWEPEEHLMSAQEMLNECQLHHKLPTTQTTRTDEQD